MAAVEAGRAASHPNNRKNTVGRWSQRVHDSARPSARLRVHDSARPSARLRVHVSARPSARLRVHVRLHGHRKLYESGYGPRALERWALRVQVWGEGRELESAVLAAPGAPATRALRRDVYVYFDNDAKVRAPFDAIALRALVRHERVPRLPARLAGAGERARVSWPAGRGRLGRPA